MCTILGCTAQVRLLTAVLCGSPDTVFPFRCLLLVGFCYGLCVLSILCICGDLCVQSVMLRACTCHPSRGVCAFYFISVVFGGFCDRGPNLFGNCRLALCW